MGTAYLKPATASTRHSAPSAARTPRWPVAVGSMTARERVVLSLLLRPDERERR